LEGLTATHQGTQFLEVSKRLGVPLAPNRGAPENSSPIGDDLTASHPVVRTNPVTGWKGLFVNRKYAFCYLVTNGIFTKRINELSKDESDVVLEYLYKHIANNHDIQVRYRWTLNGSCNKG
jgi:alpha-ketoglutarate-dependent taurine dioxygenase